jgi:hypothetical protein
MVEWDEAAWRLDTEMLTPATRGIYRDILGHLFLFDHSGVITGTREELARAGRCPVVQLDVALAELARFRVVNITERNGVITVVNRRMRRAARTIRAGPPPPPLSLRLKKDLAPSLGNTLETGGIPKGGLPRPAAAARSMSPAELEVAILAESVLNGEWPNDSRKWLNRITGCPGRQVTADPAKVRRVFEEVRNAAAEQRIKTTPARYAEKTWQEFA